MSHTGALFLALAASMDNFGIGVALSVKGIRVAPAANFLIAVMTTAGTLFPMWVGWYLNILVDWRQLGRVGALILVMLGVYLVSKYFLSMMGGTRTLEIPLRTGCLTEKLFLSRFGIVCLGLTLSLNNIPVGFAAGVAGINPIVVGVETMGASFILLWAAGLLRQRVAKARSSIVVDLISGVLILSLGLLSLLEG